MAEEYLVSSSSYVVGLEVKSTTNNYKTIARHFLVARS